VIACLGHEFEIKHFIFEATPEKGANNKSPAVYLTGLSQVQVFTFSSALTYRGADWGM